MITVEYQNHKWQFELIEIGGSSLPTKTKNITRQFESHLIVELISPLRDMTTLYLILSNLVADGFGGWIVALSDKNSHLRLSSWQVRKEDNQTFCKVGYKAWMPEETIEYIHTESV